LCEPSQEEEEVKNLLRTLVVKVKTLSRSETPLTSLLDELPGPLEDLEDLMDLEAPEDQEDLMDLEAPEDQENQRYPPIISFLSTQPEK
jgi:hypothetical protein